MACWGELINFYSTVHIYYVPNKYILKLITGRSALAPRESTCSGFYRKSTGDKAEVLVNTSSTSSMLLSILLLPLLLLLLNQQKYMTHCVLHE